ncbi:MAG: histidine phosphatase family protein [Thermomicrobiales bacterium]
MQLLLVRHGESIGNVTRQLQKHDEPLTERGRRQAGELASFLADRPDLRVVYTSPLNRAVETATIIGAAIGLRPIALPGLAEIDVGKAAGFTFDEWSERDPESVRRWREEGIDYVWPGGESGRQLAARTAAEIDRIISAHRLDRGAVVVVSHGGALAWIIAHLLREPRDRWPTHQLLNCSLTEITIEADEQAVSFLCHNDTGHLSPEPEEEAALGQTPE